MIKGQCLCGEIENSILCYCQHCQQAHGSIAGWNSPIDQQKFQFLSGQNQLRKYFHTPNKARVFCQHCASPIYSYRTDLPNIIRLRLGTVTEGHLPAPQEEFFTEHKPSFIELR